MSEIVLIHLTKQIAVENSIAVTMPIHIAIASMHRKCVMECETGDVDENKAICKNMKIKQFATDFSIVSTEVTKQESVVSI